MNRQNLADHILARFVQEHDSIMESYKKKHVFDGPTAPLTTHLRIKPLRTNHRSVQITVVVENLISEGEVRPRVRVRVRARARARVRVLV